jgi:hypothetical protein
MTRQIDEANALRWDGKRRGYYEVYYLKWNDAASRTAGWVRYTLTSPRPEVGEPYTELWGIFFDAADPAASFGVRNRFGIEALAHRAEPFSVGIGEAELTATRATGQITPTGGGPLLEWDLTLTPRDAPAKPFPHAFMYAQEKFPATKIIVPHQNSLFSGTLSAGGRKIAFVDAPGQQSHLFGSKHAQRWAWGHCNSFAEDPEAVWEGLDAEVKLGPAQPHFKYFYLKAFGREFWFNSLPQLVRNHSKWTPGGWRFEAVGEDATLRGTINSPADRFVTVGYMDPNGALLYCHNTKIATIRLELVDPHGAPLGELTSQEGCAVEYVDRRIYRGMRVYI